MSGFGSMLKRAAQTASAAVNAAVSTLGGASGGDEVLDGYKTRVDGLQRELLALKERCGLYSRAAMNLASSGNEVAADFRALYAKSTPRQTQVAMFSSAQQKVDEATFRLYSIDSFGASVLQVLDDWYTDSQRVQDDVKNAEAAFDEVRKLQERLASLRSQKEKRGQRGELNSKEDALLQQAEDMLARYEKSYAGQRGELDKKVTAFVEGRYATLDGVFVRFMELQAEYAAALAQAAQPFAGTVTAYRKKFPLNASASAVRSPRSPTNGLSPSNSLQSMSPIPDAFASPASPTAAAAAGAAAAPAPRKSASPVKSAAAADDEESSEDEDTDEDDSDEDDSESDDEAPKKAAAGSSSKPPPRVSTGSGVVSPRSSQPNSPTNGRAASASPDLLDFAGGRGGSDGGGDLMDLFSAGTGAGKVAAAASPTNRKAPAAQSTAAGTAPASADSLDMFDFSGPKPSSPTPAAAKGKGPSHSASMDFDPFAGGGGGGGAAVAPKAAAAPSTGARAAAAASTSSTTAPSAASGGGPLKRDASKSQLKQVAQGLVKTDDLDDHIAAQQEQRLKDLRENEQKAEADAASKKEAGHALEDRLNAWSLKDGQKKGIRNLLSSLHLILWPNSGWKPVGLADLIDANAIKKVQRKAMLVVHPDKLQEATPEQKVIAEHAFDALNFAYERYQETGQ